MRSGTQSNVPIIMLSAKGEVFDKVLGLELGADDYIIKPFDSKELVARVKAVLRRYQVMKPEQAEPEIKCVEYPDLIINLTNYSVMYHGTDHRHAAKGTGTSVFSCFLSKSGIHQRTAFGSTSGAMNIIGDTRTVDVHVKRLREKIKDHEHWGISTVWGIGYKFERR